MDELSIYYDCLILALCIYAWMHGNMSDDTTEYLVSLVCNLKWRSEESKILVHIYLIGPNTFHFPVFAIVTVRDNQYALNKKRTS